ncbi:MAG: hypothetical protein OSJ56_03525 [Prevotella sp.]|uniref:hypothetical protein n=1 Tax=Prevotella sp. PTAC TaxID=2736295 RepID=UPI0015567CAE|nr:hypothetical protein [Prevotella sp. PTAC]MCX4293110.1 hypothetical protein [Prevotella sp.]NPD54110.1 hypothetical protein [Prevotella sp. PTAC]
MVKEERYIKNRFGKDNHFRVPTGYFDNFASTIIDKLPEQEHRIIRRRSRIQILRPILYSAACLCLAIFGITVYLSKTEPQHDTMRSESVAHSNGGYTYTAEDAIIDHAMMDNADIYACLMSE